jgi:uncharacterized membrane protein
MNRLVEACIFKTNHTKFLVLLVCAMLGFMLAMQLKSTGRQKTVPVQRAEELTERLEKRRERPGTVDGGN